MKTAQWIIETEIGQNRRQTVVLIFISLLLGVLFTMAIKAEIKIQSLFAIDQWAADVIVLPKAVSLADFKADLAKGYGRAFLPEAMFDSTVGFAEGKFPMLALMPVGGKASPKVMVKGQRNLIHDGLIPTTVPIEAWHDQKESSTAEWGNKLIFGFLASGSDQYMRSLKDLVDKRTVGQAFLIKDQIKEDSERKAQLETALLIYSFLLIILIGFTFFSTYTWIKIRITNTFLVLDEMGFSKKVRFQIISVLFIGLVMVPFILGLTMALGIGI